MGTFRKTGPYYKNSLYELKTQLLPTNLRVLISNMTVGFQNSS